MTTASSRLTCTAAGCLACLRSSAQRRTFLAWAHDLPFKDSTLDFILSQHNLEHLEDPVQTVLSYLRMLKPGGGLGVVVPHWQYSWDTRRDGNAWGHMCAVK